MQLPEAEIHYCTKYQYQPIVAHNPYLDRVFYLEDNLWPLIHSLRAEKYDYIIDLHNNLRTLSIKAALMTKSFSLRKLNYLKWIYINFKIDQMPDSHVVDRYLKTVRPLGVVNDYRGLDYFIPSKDHLDRHDLPLAFRAGYVAFAVGGQHYTKRLPLPKIIELCEKINQPLVLLGDQKDALLAEKVRRHFEAKRRRALYREADLWYQEPSVPPVYNACGKYNLNQSAALIKDASFVFSHDTGLMHIAAAFKKKIYSIWGNTTPSLGMYPYQTEFEVIENKNAECRPCSKIGHHRCPLKHFKCLNEIHFDLKSLEKEKTITPKYIPSPKP